MNNMSHYYNNSGHSMRTFPADLTGFYWNSIRPTFVCEQNVPIDSRNFINDFQNEYSERQGHMKSGMHFNMPRPKRDNQPYNYCFPNNGYDQSFECNSKSNFTPDRDNIHPNSRNYIFAEFNQSNQLNRHMINSNHNYEFNPGNNVKINETFLSRSNDSSNYFNEDSWIWNAEDIQHVMPKPTLNQSIRKPNELTIPTKNNPPSIPNITLEKKFNQNQIVPSKRANEDKIPISSANNKTPKLKHLTKAEKLAMIPKRQTICFFTVSLNKLESLKRRIPSKMTVVFELIGNILDPILPLSKYYGFKFTLIEGQHKQICVFYDMDCVQPKLVTNRRYCCVGRFLRNNLFQCFNMVEVNCVQEKVAKAFEIVSDNHVNTFNSSTQSV